MNFTERKMREILSGQMEDEIRHVYEISTYLC